MTSDLYCCYCGEAKGDKYSCCQEHHFVPYGEISEYLKCEGDEDEDGVVRGDNTPDPDLPVMQPCGLEF